MTYEFVGGRLDGEFRAVPSGYPEYRMAVAHLPTLCDDPRNLDVIPCHHVTYRRVSRPDRGCDAYVLESLIKAKDGHESV